MTLTATQPHKIYLAGQWVDSPDILAVANPADPGNPAGATYNATEAQYEEAVTASVAAFRETRALPVFERSRALREISAGIKERREELGRILSLEAGKPIRDALVEVDPELRVPLKRAGFLTRDARIVERKKAGLHKARKAPQFSKR